MKDHAIQSSYLREVFNPNTLPTIVDSLCDEIKKANIAFDAIAFRGNSGTMIAPIVCYKLNKLPLLVRKDDGAHSSYDLEGPTQNFNYIIIDDLVSSGDTINRIKNRINSETDNRSVELKAIFLYSQDNRPSPYSVPIYYRIRDTEKWNCLNIYGQVS